MHNLFLLLLSQLVFLDTWFHSNSQFKPRQKCTQISIFFRTKSSNQLLPGVLLNTLTSLISGKKTTTCKCLIIPFFWWLKVAVIFECAVTNKRQCFPFKALEIHYCLISGWKVGCWGLLSALICYAVKLAKWSMVLQMHSEQRYLAKYINCIPGCGYVFMHSPTLQGLCIIKMRTCVTKITCHKYRARDSSQFGEACMAFLFLSHQFCHCKAFYVKCALIHHSLHITFLFRNSPWAWVASLLKRAQVYAPKQCQWLNTQMLRCVWVHSQKIIWM